MVIQILNEWAILKQKKDYLYHITNIRNLPTILKQGLLPSNAQRGRTYNTDGIYLTTDVEGTLRGLVIDSNFEINNLVLLAVPFNKLLQRQLCIDLEYVDDLYTFFQHKSKLIRYMQRNPLYYNDNKLDYVRQLCINQNINPKLYSLGRFVSSLESCSAFYTMVPIKPHNIVVVGKLGISPNFEQLSDDDYLEHPEYAETDFEFDEFDDEVSNELIYGSNNDYSSNDSSNSNNLKFKKFIGKSTKRNFTKADKSIFMTAQRQKYDNSPTSKTSNRIFIRDDLFYPSQSNFYS